MQIRQHAHIQFCQCIGTDVKSGQSRIIGQINLCQCIAIAGQLLEVGKITNTGKIGNILFLYTECFCCKHLLCEDITFGNAEQCSQFCTECRIGEVGLIQRHSVDYIDIHGIAAGAARSISIMHDIYTFVGNQLAISCQTAACYAYKAAVNSVSGQIDGLSGFFGDGTHGIINERACIILQNRNYPQFISAARHCLEGILCRTDELRHVVIRTVNFFQRTAGCHIQNGNPILFAVEILQLVQHGHVQICQLVVTAEQCGEFLVG